MLYDLRGVHGSTDACRRGTNGLSRGLWSSSSRYKKRQWQQTKLRVPFRSSQRADAVVTKNPCISTVLAALSSTVTPLAPKSRPDNNVPTRELKSGTVFAIVDRKNSPTGIKYRVKWCDDFDGFRWDDTWEHGIGLREDGFARACKVVDAEKASNVSKYYDFCKLNGHAHQIGASLEGLSVFYALGIAARLIDNADWYSTGQAHQFKAECARRGEPISPEGVAYGKLRHYVKFANATTSKDSQQISMKTLDKDVFGGVSGSHALAQLRIEPLAEGVYLWAAFSSLRVTHCMVLRVVRGEKFAYDDEFDDISIGDRSLGWVT